MKTFQQFCQDAYQLDEFQLPSSGKIVRGFGSLLNPFATSASELVGGATGALGSKIGGPVGSAVRKLAPAAGLGFAFTRAATPVGVAAATFNQGTAAGKVKVGTDPKTGKPIYMDK